MNEIILRLMNDISALTEPVNPLFLKLIFDKIPLQEEPTSADTAAHHKILLRLKALTIESLNLTNELKDNGVNQKRESILTEENKKALLAREDLFEKTKTQQELLSGDYAIIVEDAANIFLKTQNPLAVPVHFPEFNEMQQIFVTALDAELERLINETEKNRAKLQLTLLKNKLSASSDELIATGFIPTNFISLTQLKNVIASVQTEISTLNQTLENGERLQRLFAQKLSIAELQPKKDEVVLQLQLIAEELSKISKDITELTLSAEAQSNVRKDFEESTNIPELLYLYESKMSSAWSPTAWMAWLNANQQYEEEQALYTQSFKLLQLLNSQKEFITQKEQLLKEQMQLDRIVLNNSDASENQELVQLISHAVALFKSMPSPIELTQDTPVMDCYLTLISSLPLVSASLDLNKEILEKLSKMSSIVLKVETLRKKFKLNDEELPTLEEAEKDEGNLLAEDLLSKERALQIICKRYLMNLQQLNVIIEELDAAILDQELLIQQITSLKERQLSQEQISAINSHLMTLAKNIDEQIKELKLLPIPQLEPEETVIPTAAATLQLISEQSDSESDSDTSDSELSEESDETSSRFSISDDGAWSEAAQIDTNSGVSSCQSTERTTSESYSDDSESTELLASNSPSSVSRDIPVTPLNQYSDSSDEASEEYHSLECELISVGSTPSPIHSSALTSAPTKTLDESITDPLSAGDLLPNAHTVTHLSDRLLEQRDTDSDFSDNSPAPVRNDSEERPPRKSLLLTTLDNIDKWHHENLALLMNQPEEMKNWYLSLHQSIRDSSFEEPQCHKVSQLLRDILFELQNKKDLSVISAYIRLCPDPKVSIKPLLDLKPALLITDVSYNEANELMDCPLELRPHYAHYFKLRDQFPVEAELFLQAVRTVHLIKLYTNIPGRKITQDHIPSLATDPRYEPLKRHRGFLKIWEFLEDLCRLIFAKITGQPEHEYTNRPCRFFKPKSAQLIEEADLMVRNVVLVAP